MPTKHDVNFRSDGPVEVEYVENDSGGCCLKISSRRQELQVSLLQEQAEGLKGQFEKTVTVEKIVEKTVPAYSSKKKATKKKTSKKKATTKKTTGKKKKG